MIIDARDMDQQVLNEAIRLCQDARIELRNVNGQRYIGDCLADTELHVYGTPGNALGAYMNGAEVFVYGNAQDAAGDTMNGGTITIYGAAGDATGYGMRGGTILVEGNIGYRAGIHMKEYEGRSPLIIAGGTAGSFLGEYLAGGTIVVLGLGKEREMPVGNFCGTGMHGGQIILQCSEADNLPPQVRAEPVDISVVAPYIEMYCAAFGDGQREELLRRPYMRLTPNTSNPYKQLYTYI